MKTLKTCLTIACAALLFSGVALAEIVIITHPGSGAEKLNTKTAKKLFLGKIDSIPGMDNLTLVGQENSSPTKSEFTQKIAKKGLDKYKAYWSMMIFSGKAVPPQELADDEEVKAYVARHANAVGYIDASVVDDSVKVLLRAP